MIDAYLGLGGNIGDREAQIKEAIAQLDQHAQIDVIAVSPMYETKPVGYVDQPDFLNVCVHVKTTLSAIELLDVALEVEAALHRVREVRWGPRTIDIDVLLYGQDIVETERVTVPHPRMTERAFVMIPLNDIAPHVIEPRSGKAIHTLVKPDDTVVRYGG
ncbi:MULTISPECIES: 2-amino-4-hydroxy-6-hydroxymethyldihydropteridine diphosphokinase [unclassified Staphylococcus]|uniref:2-amino-4-hydroxy-6- hydroxymethyldihydropteridine diphosphokinase n=1 Tax=unclassified Staphylococcus TaxID=91994 RepID=UPI0021D0BBB7|nr:MULTISPECIES: 2-amino-4-hydroxy-6-hydroxymethyldihydropteridine diphosphokinase [unclassified Staphylococcus]UXR69783.1 2-amino-4-hydroxy-6-hydroxymethyldihydropteridine diphosphokinase [Staphylococcus sp. IVB6246]UXR71819.1 2-amino-4-hydroxy-6-hydroxymethyldihydropteridine diphosphokinase [Staphylococcus sp. IVB6240]UXR74125.1 2-amino-4-hydroxy-6-hydroxymethyldihydropteridine diphosphokinase [Staphylococcus sp. IVB6238]UXR76515.1 2-amino-4-hydroxy-6-hydroxymethyldihydropteridine diphosphoki